MNKEFKILDISYNEIADLLLLESKNRCVLLTYYNFNTNILINKKPEFCLLLKEHFYIHNDGIGSYLFSKSLFGNKLRYNINGSNLYPVLVKKLLDSDKKVFVLFSHNNNNNMIKSLVKESFGEKSELIKYAVYEGNNDDTIKEKIRTFNPDAIFAGLGQPYQEEWVFRNKELINTGLMICSGSGFEYIVNRKKRAPESFQKAGFEWLYRLFQEPTRLWKRYIIGIPVFLFHVLRQKIKLIIKKPDIS
ncbi:MAG: WecB/TagA/CpsF family glycosyltransferase [Ignavibacteria bacterium]